jgi:tetratricopeptide (TPR) repeat protein
MAKGKGPGKKRKLTVDIEKLGKAPKSKPKSAAVPTDKDAEPIRLPLEINWKYLIIFGCGAVFLAILAYINTISNTLVFQDRAQLIPFASTVNWDSFWSTLPTDAVSKPFTQPWVKLSYALDWNNYKSTVSWFHAANAAVHTLTTVYVYAFGWGLSRHWRLKEKFGLNEEFLALCTASIFAVHPFTCETVTYLSSRSPLLATNNFMLALNTFLVAVLSNNLRIKAWSWWLTLAACCMCVMSGTEALALPAAMLLTLWAIKPAEQQFADWIFSRRFTLILCALLFLGMPFLLTLGTTHPTGTSFALDMLSPPGYFQAQLAGFFVYYLPKFFVPFGLSIDPQYAWRDALDYTVIAGLAATMTVAALAVKFRQMPFVGYALAFTLLTLLPHAILIQPQAVADSVFYLPMIGLGFLTGGLFAVAYRQEWRAAVAGFTVVAIAFLSLTIWRNSEWSSDIALWESTVRASQRSVRAHAMLSLELAKDQKTERAKEEAERATKMDESGPLAWIAKGNTELVNKDFARAEKSFEKAIELSKTKVMPSEVTTASGLGLSEAYVRQHKTDKALTILYSVAQNAKGDPRVSIIAALVAYEQKNWSKAFPYLRQALQLNPGATELWAKLADTALVTGRYGEAMQAAMMAERVEPSTTNQILLARAFFGTFRAAEGRKLLTELLAKEPKNAEVLALLSRACIQSGETTLATKYRSEALSIDPHIFSKISLKEVDQQPRNDKDQTTTSAPTQPGNLAATRTAAPAQPPAAVITAPAAKTTGPAQPGASPDTAGTAAPAPDAKTSPPATKTNR